jgi:hypothetical protein
MVMRRSVNQEGLHKEGSRAALRIFHQNNAGNAYLLMV